MKMDLDKRLKNIHQYTKLHHCFENIHREHDPEQLYFVVPMADIHVQ